MNPAEKVKAILDGFTEPLSKDHPFGTGGRKAKFSGDSLETKNLTFQAFVNRISTFKPEHWGSDPNAAIYLAKYGFKTVEKCNVRCCTCHAEIDMKIFLGKADALQTIAKQLHKPYCRWLGVSTPKEYFEIPRNPHRTLEELKTSFTETLTFESRLPIIRKETWLKMGLTEDFITAVLNYLEFPYSDLMASCVVLSLCGWVKSSNTSLQCNFCQRVVGIWNFFSDVESSNGSPANKQSKVVSLLYSEIRREMMEVDEPVGGTESEKTDVNSPSPKMWEIGEQASESDSDDHSIESGLVRIDHEMIYRAQEIKKRALKFLWTKTRRIGERNYYRMLMKIERSFGRDHVDTDHRHSPTPLESGLYEGNGESSVGSSSNVSDHNNQSVVDTECESNKNESSDKNGFCSGEHDNNDDSHTSLVKNPGDTFSVENDKSNLIESSSKLKSSNNTSEAPDEADAHSESSGVEELCPKCLCVQKCIECISNSDCNRETKRDKSAYHEKDPKCSCEFCKSSVQSSQSEKNCNHSALSHTEPFGNSDRSRKRKRVPECEQNGTPHDPDDDPHQDVQSIHIKKSKRREVELQSNDSTKSTSPSSGHDNEKDVIDGCVSKDEGDSDIEVKTTHSQAEVGGNNNCNDVNYSCTNDTRYMENNSLNIRNDEEDKTEMTPIIFSVVGNAVIPPDSPEEEEPEIIEETNSSCINNREEEFSEGPIIVSSKSVPDEEMLQDYVEEEGRKFENRFKAKPSYSDISDNEPTSEPTVCSSENISPENITERSASKSVQVEMEPSVLASKSCQAELGSSEADSQESLPPKRCKRKREEIDEDNNCIPKKPNLEDLKLDICQSYFHPELEHRYWCIWKIQVADHLGECCGRKKGWEYFAESIKKALELQSAERIPFGQIESNHFRLAEFVASAGDRL